MLLHILYIELVGDYGYIYYFVFVFYHNFDNNYIASRFYHEWKQILHHFFHFHIDYTFSFEYY